MGQIDVQSLVETTEKKVYPNIQLETFDMTLPILARNFKSGDIPVYAIYKGVEKVVANISASLINYNNILSLYGSFILNESSDVTKRVTSLDDIVEG